MVKTVEIVPLCAARILVVPSCYQSKACRVSSWVVRLPHRLERSRACHSPMPLPVCFVPTPSRLEATTVHVCRFLAGVESPETGDRASCESSNRLDHLAHLATSGVALSSLSLAVSHRLWLSASPTTTDRVCSWLIPSASQEHSCSMTDVPVCGVGIHRLPRQHRLRLHSSSLYRVSVMIRHFRRRQCRLGCGSATRLLRRRRTRSTCGRVCATPMAASRKGCPKDTKK